MSLFHSNLNDYLQLKTPLLGILVYTTWYKSYTMAEHWQTYLNNLAQKELTGLGARTIGVRFIGWHLSMEPFSKYLSSGDQQKLCGFILCRIQMETRHCFNAHLKLFCLQAGNNHHNVQWLVWDSSALREAISNLLVASIPNRQSFALDWYRLINKGFIDDRGFIDVGFLIKLARVFSNNSLTFTWFLMFSSVWMELLMESCLCPALFLIPRREPCLYSLIGRVSVNWATEWSGWPYVWLLTTTFLIRIPPSLFLHCWKPWCPFRTAGPRGACFNSPCWDGAEVRSWCRAMKQTLGMTWDCLLTDKEGNSAFKTWPGSSARLELDTDTVPLISVWCAHSLK